MSSDAATIASTEPAGTPGGATGQDWRPRAASLLGALVIWECAARLLASPVLPPASAVLAALIAMTASGEILGNLAISLGALTIGYAAAAVVGVGVGAAMGRFRPVEVILEPYLNALLASPALIYVPVLFTLFGATRLTQVGAVFLHTVFVITVTTQAGVRNTSPALVEMAAAFGATERQIFWKIRLPEAWPFVMTGLRIGVPLAVKGMVNGEMFIAFMGLGALVQTYGGRFEPDRVLAILVVLILVALAGTSLLDAVDRRIRRPA